MCEKDSDTAVVVLLGNEIGVQCGVVPGQARVHFHPAVSGWFVLNSLEVVDDH